MNIAVIFHDADFDGILSREVCCQWLRQLGHNTTFIGWDYGRPVPNQPWETFDRIYIVDLSVDDLMGRTELRDKIVWIDHHKSAIEKWKEITFDGIRLDGVAACRLCWAWFTQSAKELPKHANEFDAQRPGEPRLIYLAGVYDVWLKSNPDFDDGKTLQFGLRALTQSAFDELVHYAFWTNGEDQFLKPVLESGRAIRSYCQKQNDEYSYAYAHTIEWEGLKFCALNIGQRGNSDLLLGGIKAEHDACFAWRWTGKEVLVSLYHIAGHEHHDLSQIAVKYGGGGHRGACGFRMSLSQLEKVLTSTP